MPKRRISGSSISGREGSPCQTDADRPYSIRSANAGADAGAGSYLRTQPVHHVLQDKCAACAAQARMSRGDRVLTAFRARNASIFGTLQRRSANVSSIRRRHAVASRTTERHASIGIGDPTSSAVKQLYVYGPRVVQADGTRACLSSATVTEPHQQQLL